MQRAAYNRRMLHTLQTMFAPAVMSRLTLAANHVLGAEPAATARLLPHAGRCIEVTLERWPSLLPQAPVMAFRVTPAGMLDWCGNEPLTQADLRMQVDASNPAALLAQLMTGEAPAVEISGDSTLAADVNWLVQNLRWDIEADLERLFGPAVAQPLARLGSALARALRAAVQGASGLLRPRAR
jgi:ubiquinone biosynthesis accessory factor UbiJ